MDGGRGVVGLALVPDVHDVAGVTIGGVIGDNLGAAVGEEDTVLAIGGVAVTGFVLAELHVAVVVVLGVNAVPVLVLGGCLLVGRLLVGGLLVRCRGVGGRGVGGHGGGHGDEGEEGDEGLKRVMIVMKSPF